MSRRLPPELPNEYWVDWSLRSGLSGWRVGPMHWRMSDGKTACGAKPTGGTQIRSSYGVKALDFNPVCGIRRCGKCLRRWQKRVKQLLSEQTETKAALEAERWDKKGQPLIRYLKMF